MTTTDTTDFPTLTDLLGEGTLLLADAERWQREVGADRSWPSATSFPELDWVEPTVPPLAAQLDGLVRMLGAGSDQWPSATSFPPLES